MTYDVAFRHQQALDPSALTTIATTLHAIEAAITDCRNAGKDAEADPAVVLLARHLGTVCQAHPADPELRQRSMAEIARLRQFPTLRTLAIRGVAYDEAAKRAFHGEGRRALRRLADALNFEADTYDLRSNRAGAAVSGEITLHGDEVWVRLSLGALGPDHEVSFRRVSGRSDHWASVRELLAPDRFAERIRRELRLIEPAPAARTRLFA